MSKKNRNKPIAYSLFSGAGGLKIGIEKAGFEVAVSSDISEHARQTHLKNWTHSNFLLGDIRQITHEDLLACAGGKKPNLLIGGPPCQGFSTLGDKLSSDPRNQLFKEFLRIARELTPELILIENVKALSTMYKGQFAQWIKEELRAIGYNVYHEILNAADFGVPQIRNRTFIVGSTSSTDFEFPKETHGELTGASHVTVGEALNGLPEDQAGIPNHIPLNHSDTVIARYKLIPEGGRLPPPEELPVEIRRKNFGNTYKRLDRSAPSLTMVPGNNAFPVHPTFDRSLTPREAARLQTFPDSFEFTGDRRNQCILVGNAVPPLLAEQLGNKLIKHLRDGYRPNSQLTLVQNKLSEPSKILPFISDTHKKGDHTFVDLFSGAGGFTIGFSAAGWSPLLGVDLNPNAANTHLKNYPGIPFEEADLSQPEVKSRIISNLKSNNIGVVVGGPPCQGFSIFGKRRFINTKDYDPHKDDRNKLVYAFTDMVSDLNPRWFVMENVAGLVNLDKGLFLNSLLKEFRDIGYDDIEWRVLNAADYGVPQLRKRLVIIGNRSGHIIPWPKKKFFDDPSDWQKPFRTVGEVITDLALASSYDRVSCHVPMKHKPLLIERYKYIPEGGKLEVEALPEHLQTGYRTKKVKNYSHIFKRLHRDKPSITMVPGHNAFPIHPWLNRALTVREAARIQTFPDEVEFLGSRQEQCIQVGNAFPPLLAELMANNIKKAEVNNWYPGEVPKSAYYALVEKPKFTEENCSDELELVG